MDCICLYFEQIYGFQGCSISRTALNLNCFILRPTHKMSLTSPPKQAVLKPHKAQAPWQ